MTKLTIFNVELSKKIVSVSAMVEYSTRPSIIYYKSAVSHCS